MQAKKLITYHFLASSLSKHMGLHWLQDYKERRCHDQGRNIEELVSFLQEPTLL
jgi:hypothetical protein